MATCEHRLSGVETLFPRVASLETVWQKTGALEVRIGALEARTLPLEMRMNSLENNVNIEIAKVGALTNRTGALEARSATIEGAAGKVAARVAAIEQRIHPNCAIVIGGLQTRLAAVEGRTNNIEPKVAGFTNRQVELDAMKLQLAATKAENDTLKRQVQNLTERLNNVDQNQARVQTQIPEFNQRVSAIHDAGERDRAGLRQVINQQTAQMNEMRALIETSVTQIGELSEKVNLLQSDLLRAQTRMSNASMGERRRSREMSPLILQVPSPT
jgi:chromosome segregation ATPase